MAKTYTGDDVKAKVAAAEEKAAKKQDKLKTAIAKATAALADGLQTLGDEPNPAAIRKFVAKVEKAANTLDKLSGS